MNMAKKEKDKGEGTPRGTVATMAILMLLGAGFAGYLVYPLLNPCHRNTTLYITIDADFGLSFDGGAINSTFNCSEVGADSMLFSQNVFDAISAFFEDNRTKFLGENNVTTETGLSTCTAGYSDLMFVANTTIYGYPDNLTKYDGASTKFTFGDMVVMFSGVYVGVWYNGSENYEDFTFEEIDTFSTDFFNGVLNRTTWLAAKPYMWRGVDSIEILDWQQMTTGPDLLYVNFNGVPTTMIATFMGP
jgi:hypothetical protein